MEKDCKRRSINGARPTVCCLGEQTNRPIIGALLPEAHPFCWTYSVLRRAKHDPEIDPEKLIDMIALDKALAGKNASSSRPVLPLSCCFDKRFSVRRGSSFHRVGVGVLKSFDPRLASIRGVALPLFRNPHFGVHHARIRHKKNRQRLTDPSQFSRLFTGQVRPTLMRKKFVASPVSDTHQGRSTA
jgi:hypothetical protein